MAKIIDLNAHKQNIPEGDIMTDFFDMLRAVVDGDKAAMEQLRSMLDFIDENGFGPDAMDSPSLAETDETYNSDGKESALTLRRNHIRELHLHIKLNRTDLKIWREIKVPSNLTLTTLGEVLQDAMGWMHEHLYQFRKGDVYFVDHEQLEDSFGFGRFTYKDMDKCTVDDLLTEKGKRVIFEYDFGDSWEHDLWYKGEREYEKGEKPTISYVKGRRVKSCTGRLRWHMGL